MIRLSIAFALFLLLLAAPAFAQFVPTGRHFGPKNSPSGAVFVWIGADANGPWSWPKANDFQPNIWHTAELPADVPANATHVDVSWLVIGTNASPDITNAYFWLRAPGADGLGGPPRDQWMAMPFGGFRQCGGVAKVPVVNHKIEWGYWVTAGRLNYGLLLFCEGYDVP